ncbi:MAG: hypothetical protein ACQEQF_00010 [Bacillota bacterium]
MRRSPYKLYVRNYPNDISVVYWDYDYQQKRLLVEKSFETELAAWKYLFKNYKFTPKDVNFLEKYSGDIDDEMRIILYGDLRRSQSLYEEVE